MSASLLIADVPWLLYRSYFALPKSITDGEGRPVNALLGTVNALLALLEPKPPAEVPRAVIACMGAEEAEYRVGLYPPYHAHRDPMPPELAHQWKQAPVLMEALGWINATDEKLEADDVMYSFALAEQAAGGQALLLTGDRDLYGAVTDSVSVVALGKGGSHELIGPAGVRERYGIEPSQVPDFIALRGDPSDGLPGAPGIGAKTAAELLKAHGSLEQLLSIAAAVGRAEAAVAGAMRPRIAASLVENEQLLLDFKRIATLQEIDVEVPSSTRTDHARGAECASAMGLRRLAERLGKLATA
jgi:5'-3' exonuclease